MPYRACASLAGEPRLFNLLDQRQFKESASNRAASGFTPCPVGLSIGVGKV